MPRIFVAIKNYWLSKESNIFKNHIDAICGAVVLILLPGISLVLTVAGDGTTWANYFFPIVSISLAGAYDTYGRYEPQSPKNFKLGVRVVLDFLAIIVSACFVGRTVAWAHLIAPILLLLSGLSIAMEVISRIRIAIALSPWYSSL